MRPVERRSTSGCDVLRDGVEEPGDAAIDALVLPGPEAGEDVVGASPEQEGVQALHPGDDLFADQGIGQRCLPATEGEPALGVLLRSAGCLSDAVERREEVDVDESHGVLQSRFGWFHHDNEPCASFRHH